MWVYACMGAAKLARDKYFQALFAVKGVPANTYNYSTLDVRNNAELSQLATILGTDLGNKFDIKKCKFKRILIGTDADADGYKITSLLEVFFIVHMPELIEAGMVYKMLPPLYALQGGKKINGSEYIDSKKDLNQIIQKEVSNNNTIKSEKTGKNLKPKEIVELIQVNRDYVRQLVRLSNRTSVDAELLEFAIKNKECTAKQLANKLNKAFKHMNAVAQGKDKVLAEGVFSKEFQYAVIDEKLMKKAKEVSALIDHNEKKLYGMDFKLNGEKISMYSMMTSLLGYSPKTIRFKGLGEMDPKQLWKSTLDPENRRLIRLTTEDVKKDISKFSILHSDKKKDRDARAEMFRMFKIDREDIDN